MVPTIANILDPLRVIFRRAIRRDEISIDPTDNLDLPAIRGRRDRIEPPDVAHELLAALPDSERAFWAVALFCGLRRGELRGLQWSTSTPVSSRSSAPGIQSRDRST